MDARRASWIADVAFGEIALQATYSFRQGNPVPPAEGRRMVERSRRRVRQSKGLVAGLLGLICVGAAILLRPGVTARADVVTRAPPGVFAGGLLTGVFAVDVALLWWMGIQALPTFLGSSVLTVLETLPIERATLRRVASLLFLRMFDLPAAVVLVGTPLGVGLALGVPSGLAAIPGAVTAVVFALALSVLTGRFFVRRIQGSRGGGGGTLVRWAYLILWLIPSFALLAFVTAAPAFFRALDGLAGSRPAPTGLVISSAYPFPLAVWPALAARPALGVPAVVADLALLTGAGYVALAVVAAVWLQRSLAEIGHLPASLPVAGPTANLALRPQRPPAAVLTKDLRLASRTPTYAFLLLLPLLDAVALGLVTFVGGSNPTTGRGIALGAVSTAALLATFFGPAFFALEVIAQSYARTLPLAPRSMALGKVALIAGVYLAAGGIVLAIASFRVHAVGLFAAFLAAELPAVVAAGLAEIGILGRWGRARGLPVTNLYAGTWNALLVALPGLAIVAAPLVAFLVRGLLPMALVSGAALLVVAPVVLGRRSP